MNAAKINNIFTHYRLDGPRDGLTLVFANSLGTDLRIWDDVVGELADYRCLRYDKRGHGLTSLDQQAFTMADLVADLDGLLDALGVHRAVLIGDSVGGMISLGLSAGNPGRCAGLVLCDTAHIIGNAELWNGRITAVRQRGIEAIADTILERWFPPSFHSHRANELELWRAMLTRTTAGGYTGVCAAIRDADLTAAAQAVTMPTLCLVGSEDGATPPGVVRGLADLIEGSEFHVIDGAGHLPCIERPGETVTLIRAFLEKHGLDH